MWTSPTGTRSCRSSGIDRLRLPQTILDDLLCRARAAAPREIVGVLVGSSGCATDWIEFSNAWPAPGAFALSEADRDRASSDDVLALVHSHPTDLPIPSGIDLEGAAENSVHAILSLAPPSLRAWRIFSRQALPVSVEIA